MMIRLAVAVFFGATFSHAVLASEAQSTPPEKSGGQTKVELSAQGTRWPEPAKAPANAPNVIVVMLDDVGFAASSTYGGAAETPVLQALAAHGLRYNDFNVTALCSPTRAALLSGRNSHRLGFGTVAELARAQPGYNSVWPRTAAPLAEVLRENGYSTAAFGKWHNTPAWEVSGAGPFDRWPTSMGFEHFYGFMAGETSQWEPVLYDDRTLVERPVTGSYYFTTDMTDKAIGWLRAHESLAPGKPYFLYYAPGATHVPHQVPKAWIEKYRGQFDDGWDDLRKKIFARQKALGVIPAGTDLPEKPRGVPAWDSLSPEQKKLAARQMEVYAGFMSEADHEVGRLLDAMRGLPNSDNTLVFYIVGDNGADSTGGPHGTQDDAAEILYGVRAGLHDTNVDLNKLGGPDYDNIYASGWAWALSTPFRGIKGDGSHFGGYREGMVVSWPSRIKDDGGLRTQFTHVTDIAPTIYDAAGIKFPEVVDGVQQLPLDGASFVYSFADARAPSRHAVQYFETMGNRSIYDDGWVAAAPHWVPWDGGSPSDDFKDDRWELYNVGKDFSEAHDLAAVEPERLKRLRDLFDREAERNEVLPLGNAFSGGRILGASQPSLTAGRSKFVYHPAEEPFAMSAAPNLTRSNSIHVDLVIPPRGKIQGTILSIGSRFGGVALYVKDGRLTYENNFFGLKHDTVTDPQPLPRGKVSVAFDLSRDDQKRGGGGWGQLLVNGKTVGKGHFDHIGWSPALFGAFDIGAMRVSPVTDTGQAPFEFTGTIEDITIELK